MARVHERGSLDHVTGQYDLHSVLAAAFPGSGHQWRCSTRTLSQRRSDSRGDARPVPARHAFSCPCAHRERAPVVVMMTLTRDKPLEWEFAGVIRRVVPQELGERMYGCEFDEMVSWEQLGELLLRGVLSPE